MAVKEENQMPLPMLIHDQDALLTLNQSAQPVFDDATMPGVDMQLFFLDSARYVTPLQFAYSAGA